jgi:hypothetical protein
MEFADILRIHGKSAKYIYVDVIAILPFSRYKSCITAFSGFPKYRFVGEYQISKFIEN